MRQFWTLASLTAVETIRQPVCLLITVSMIMLTGVTPLVLLHQFSEEGKVARDTGLTFHLILGIVMVGYAAASVLSREIRNGTAALFLSKPIPRHVYFLAKYVGLLVVVLAFSYCATLSTLLAERVSEHRAFGVGHAHQPRIDWRAGNLMIASPCLALLVAGIFNYRSRRPFITTAYVWVAVLLTAVFAVCGFWDRFGQWGGYDLLMDARLLPASLLVTLALAVFAALALSLSTRLATMPTVVTCLLVLLAGLMQDYALAKSKMHVVWDAAVRGVIPNWQHFWMADALLSGGTISWAYVGGVIAYAGVYAAAILLVGYTCFTRLDMR